MPDFLQTRKNGGILRKNAVLFELWAGSNQLWPKRVGMSAIPCVVWVSGLSQSGLKRPAPEVNLPKSYDTRNQVVAQAARGFESHPIRHIAGAKFALLRLFYVQISSIFAFGDFPFAFKTPALRQSKPCLHCLRRGYLGAVAEMGITVDEGSAGGYVAFQLRS